MIDTSYLDEKKRRHLILTEAGIKPGGSDRSVKPEGIQGIPYNRSDGPLQWDRQLHRYRTYEEQKEYEAWLWERHRERKFE